LLRLSMPETLAKRKLAATKFDCMVVLERDGLGWTGI
jgi:hypothetical protein